MILWRYILRAHVGPFLFANAVIIFLFLLQFLMKSAGDIVGKGLSTWVILELIALNLAWMVVLAVPMSVLVSTLMGFGKMSSNNEIVIMRASGMSMYRMLIPVLAVAAILTYGLIIFNNQILPEANIRLRSLMTDILRIKPTLSLQAGVFTSESELPNYRILVKKTFETSNDIEGVTIYDLSRPDKNIVVTAERGKVSFSQDYSKIYMDLEEGEIHELNTENYLSYRKLEFMRHRVAIPASGFGFERSDAATAQRDDRTMNAQMMREIVDSSIASQSRKITMLAHRISSHIDGYLAGKPEFQIAPPDAFERIRMNPDQRTPIMQRKPELEQTVPKRDTAVGVWIPTVKDSIDAAFHALSNARQIQSSVLADISGIRYDEGQINKYLVEIYKKYSIPVACIVFVLIGAPLGMMARRGGFGVGAGLSLGFFLFYWACLIGGEKLADRDILSPFWGMWIANIVLGLCGLYLTIRSARETRVIDWSRLSRFVPKSWRVERPETHINPYEA